MCPWSIDIYIYICIYMIYAFCTYWEALMFFPKASTELVSWHDTQNLPQVPSDAINICEKRWTERFCIVAFWKERVLDPAYSISSWNATRPRPDIPKALQQSRCRFLLLDQTNIRWHCGDVGVLVGCFPWWSRWWKTCHCWFRFRYSLGCERHQLTQLNFVVPCISEW